MRRLRRRRAVLAIERAVYFENAQADREHQIATNDVMVGARLEFVRLFAIQIQIVDVEYNLAEKIV
jgi:hypothetical protein